MKILAFITAFLFSHSAQAQSFDNHPAIWSGPYTGITLGFGGAEMVTSDGTGSSDGREIVVFTGFSWVRGNMMFGTEADLSTNIGRDTIFGEKVPVGSTSAAVDWMTSFRGRFGWVDSQNLVYATAGVVYSDTVAQGRTYDWGYVVGGGYERRMSGRWSWRGEALFHYFDPEGVAAPRAELDRAWTVRMGITRHF